MVENIATAAVKDQKHQDELKAVEDELAAKVEDYKAKLEESN